jgi:hypothetical protein
MDKLIEILRELKRRTEDENALIKMIYEDRLLISNNIIQAIIDDLDARISLHSIEGSNPREHAEYMLCLELKNQLLMAKLDS